MGHPTTPAGSCGRGRRPRARTTGCSSTRTRTWAFKRRPASAGHVSGKWRAPRDSRRQTRAALPCPAAPSHAQPSHALLRSTQSGVIGNPCLEPAEQCTPLRSIIAEPDPGAGDLRSLANVEQIGHFRIVLGGDAQRPIGEDRSGADHPRHAHLARGRPRSGRPGFRQHRRRSRRRRARLTGSQRPGYSGYSVPASMAVRTPYI